MEYYEMYVRKAHKNANGRWFSLMLLIIAQKNDGIDFFIASELEELRMS